MAHASLHSFVYQICIFLSNLLFSLLVIIDLVSVYPIVWNFNVLEAFMVAMVRGGGITPFVCFLKKLINKYFDLIN